VGKPKVSIIMLNLNGKQFIKECIDTVLAQRCKGDFEIVFVDNASTDGSVEELKRHFSRQLRIGKIRLVLSKVNTGFAGGNNLGARNIGKSVETIILLNNDVLVHKNWLPELLKPLQHKEVSVVGCIGTGPDSPPEAKRNPDYWYGVKKVCEGMNLFGSAIVRKMSEDEIRTGMPRPFFAGGVCVAFRRKEIPKPFDDDYFAYAEDVALSWEQRLRGREVVIARKSVMFHYGGSAKKSSWELSKFLSFHGTKNEIMNFLIFYEKKNIVRLFLPFAVWETTILFSSPRLFLVRLRAWWWVLTHLGLIARKRKAMQRKRKVPDRALLEQMNAVLMDGYAHNLQSAKGLLIRMANRLLLWYCWIVGIRTRDMQA
jgi:GT2 family glycosyltransferase